MYRTSTVKRKIRFPVMGIVVLALLLLLASSMWASPVAARPIEIPADTEELVGMTYSGSHFFKFPVTYGQTLKVFIPENADDIYVILYDPDGLEIRRANNRAGPGTKTLEYTFTWGDVWYLHVQAPGSLQYDLQVTWSQDGKVNHPPKLTEAVFLEYKPLPGGGLGTLVFEVKATDEDGDRLRFKWNFGYKELKEETGDISTTVTEKDGITAVRMSVPAPSRGWPLIVQVYDDKGGMAYTLINWELPQGTYISEYDLPKEPFVEAVMGKVTVSGKEILPGDYFILSADDVVETAPSQPESDDVIKIPPEGGFAVIKYPTGGSIKIGPDTHLRYFNQKKLGLSRGRIRIDEEKLGTMPVKVVGPQTLEDAIESIEDKDHREAVRERLKQVDTNGSIGKWAGTQFEVVVEEDGTTTYCVFEDVVDVSDIEMKKTVTLHTGEMTIVEPGGVPSDPSECNIDSLDKWWEWIGDAYESASPDAMLTSGLTFESRSKARWSTVQIPLTLSGVQDALGNMDLVLFYDPSVLEATEVINGSLTSDSLFDHNIDGGTARVSLADNEGFSGDGSVAYVKFNVIGIEGSTSPLDIISVLANRAADYEQINLATSNGVFRVIDLDEAMADCNGDGEISVVDALCALQMAVNKIDEDLVMDVTGDGRVSSLDARQILQMAVGNQSTGEAGGTVNDIEQFKNLAAKCEPAEITLSIGDDNEMEILYRVEGETEGSCVLYEKVIKDATGMELEGKNMTCNIPIEIMTQDDALSADFDIKKYCNGSLADAVQEIGEMVVGDE